MKMRAGDENLPPLFYSRGRRWCPKNYTTRYGNLSRGKFKKLFRKI